MARFDAGQAVGKLDYDFSAFSGSRGTIPEPSQDQYRTFQDALLEAMPDVDLNDPAALRGVDFHASNEVVHAAVADLCGGSPTREELDALPARVYNAFFGWLIGSFQDPTWTPGTKR